MADNNNNNITNDVDMAANRSPSPEDRPEVLDIPFVPRGKERPEWMKRWVRNSITRFAQRSMKINKVPDLNNPDISRYLKDSEKFLNVLERDPSFQMTPEIKAASSIQSTFDLILSNPKVHFPDYFKERAQRILDSFVASNWGADTEERSEESEDEDEETDPANPITSRTTNSSAAISTATAGQVRILAPSPRHPIWGMNGIMHGAARKALPKGGYSKVLDRRYKQTPCNRWGHNGLDPGTWFPFQLLALFHGAHGSSQGGIHGDRQHGAYSIVIASKYHGLDRDDGDRIYYSGAGSEENTDPNQIKEGKYDAALAASIRSQKPVRVLRSASNGTYSPSVGIRYDGLYRVVSQETRRNAKHGLYTRFVLERLPGQPNLRLICETSPTRQQIADFAKIKEAF